MKRLSICLIAPKFEPSYWGREYALPLLPGDKRAWTMPGVLTLLAGLLPATHEVVLIDESVEAIDFEALRRFDVIGVTGQIVQRARMVEILEHVRDLPATVVVGGPYAAINEKFFAGLCDVVFVGEADQTWPDFIEALAQGAPVEARYEQKEPTDMSTLPPSRFELLKTKHYVSASIQYSRGCPFTCEFCDIIVIFGRRPRVKTPEQVVAELEGVRQAGFSVCVVVDDNFIGNKVAVKKMLPAVIKWQEENGYPLSLATEATLNLADDPELMDLMVQANFREVFIGIESPRAESLKETKKLQNIRGESMLSKLDHIRDAGLVTSAGFIVGFDNDDTRIFQEQVQFIEAASIAQVSVGLLVALPKTPLYDRLGAEGRLTDDNDACNFVPKQMSREELVDGCADALRELYSAEAFLGRVVRNVTSSEGFREKRAAMAARADTGGSVIGALVSSGIIGFRLARAMAREGMLWRGIQMYMREYRKQRAVKAMSFPVFLYLCALHWHHYRQTHLYARDNTERGMNIIGPARVEAKEGVAKNHMADV
ncbi:radical SAM protein [Shimia sp. Alg240-R146]|uniref:radical SAM protein n=1 Tax=Shimia sp. Alg240-R146 TaxID=2993449 RepID=UPI0022E5A1D8|nr:radical SAM protein [Shimia sp. Alg240-R146]